MSLFRFFNKKIQVQISLIGASLEAFGRAYTALCWTFTGALLCNVNSRLLHPLRPCLCLLFVPLSKICGDLKAPRVLSVDCARRDLGPMCSQRLRRLCPKFVWRILGHRLFPVFGGILRGSIGPLQTW